MWSWQGRNIIRYIDTWPWGMHNNTQVCVSWLFTWSIYISLGTYKCWWNRDIRTCLGRFYCPRAHAQNFALGKPTLRERVTHFLACDSKLQRVRWIFQGFFNCFNEYFTMIFTLLFCLAGVIRRAVGRRHLIHPIAQECAADAESLVVEDAAKEIVRILTEHKQQ